MGPDINDAVQISEFRKNTKVILDAAVNDPVYLRRGDDIFSLSLVGKIGFISSGNPGKNNSIAAQPFKSSEKGVPPIISRGISETFTHVASDPDDYLADAGYENSETDPAEFDEAPRKRIVADVLAEMTQYKADIAERLENCQDADTTKQINKECSDTLNSMWAEVAALKKGEN